MSKEEAFKKLGQYRKILPRKIIKTIAGQIKAGDIEAAMKGLNRLLQQGEFHGC